MAKKLNRSRKGLFCIKNADDKKCFNRFLVRYLNPSDHRPARIRKIDKDFARKLDFKDFYCNFSKLVHWLHRFSTMFI